MDKFVQETCQSSLLSKYSTEKAGYFRNKDNFFEHFLHKRKKNVQRSPLIHWGYFFRHELIDCIVTYIAKRYFSSNFGQIINLGCGMDGTYFRLKSRKIPFRYFVDCDLSLNIHIKSLITIENNDLSSLCGENVVQYNCGIGEHSGVASSDYCSTYADINNIDTVRRAFFENKFCNLNVSEPTLILSECVLSYCDGNDGDRLIQYIKEHFSGPVIFLLFEQLICPDEGIQDHDKFSETMTSHFKKIQSPLLSITLYPSLSSQSSRFDSHGWNFFGVSLSDIWHECLGRNLKCNDHFLNEFYSESSLLSYLLSIESFDEWEEWDLTLQHYFIGVATTDLIFFDSFLKDFKALKRTRHSHILHFLENIKQPFIKDSLPNNSESIKFPRRFAHRSIPVTFLDCNEVHVVSFGGFGETLEDGPKTCYTRRNDLILITGFNRDANIKNITAEISPYVTKEEHPCARVYHSFISCHDGSFILHGGRRGPYALLSDLWRGFLTHQKKNELQGPQVSWQLIQIEETPLLPRYRHACDSFNDSIIISGGISVKDGKQFVLSDINVITLSSKSMKQISFITSKDPSNPKKDIPHLTRFSHTMHFVVIENDKIGSQLGLESHLNSDRYGRLYLIGGRNMLGPTYPSVTLILVPFCKITDDQTDVIDVASPWVVIDSIDVMDRFIPSYESSSPPIHISFPYKSSHTSNFISVPGVSSFILVLGGLSYDIQNNNKTDIVGRVRLEYNALLLDITNNCWYDAPVLQRLSSLTLINHSSVFIKESKQLLVQGGGFTCFSMGTFFGGSYIFSIEPLMDYLSTMMKLFYALSLVSTSIPHEVPDFTRWFTPQRPLVFRGINLGNIRNYSFHELIDKCDSNTQVSVHVSDSPALYFHQRNFDYKVMKFSELIWNIVNDKSKYYYMRAVGSDPRNEVANLSISFPSIAKLFTPPGDLIPGLESKLFSSVLRVASPSLCLWTHYDVLDNILCQIIGRKRVVLWPPSDLPYLYVEGSSSTCRLPYPLAEEFRSSYPLIKQSSPFIMDLEPGDILFIPALWFHHVSGNSEDPSLAINLFWKEEPDKSLYDSKDLYGNKDLIPAQRAMEKITAAMKDLLKLPKRYRNFYWCKCLQLLQQYCSMNDHS